MRSRNFDRLDDILRHGSQRSPDKAAVVCGEAALTYREIDRASSELSRRLRALGVRPGDRIGLLCSRGLASVVALFAVLRCRAAYVPLDPTGPIERALRICRRCGVEHLVTGMAQARRLAAAPEEVEDLLRHILHVIVVVEGPHTASAAPYPAASLFSVTEGAIADLRPAPPEGDVESSPDDALACILATSGSTGEPKGVMISHRAVLSFASWAAGYVGLDHQDRCANHAPLFFDLSTFEIYATMLAGGTVVIVPPALTAFPAALLRYIGQQGITVWYSVPAVWLDLLARAREEQLDLDDLRSLHTIIYAGEPFPADKLRELMHHLPWCALYNFFGPTETNVCAAHRLPGPPDHDATEVPIGQLCNGFSGLLLDESGRPVPRGEVGELYVTGPSMMEGYWGMPEETARALCVPRVLAHDREAERHYRTGDLVRRASDGLLYFVGRRDTQVKIQGVRVELGEIEAALRALPRIREACALVTSEKVLVAFITVDGDDEVDTVAVLDSLRQRLPGYMIPRLVSGPRRLPRTATGKVDRQQLVEALSKVDAEPEGGG